MTGPVRVRILIVADQEETINWLSHHFRQEEAFVISSAADMEAGLTKAQTEWPSLIVLDLQRPAEMLELCRVLKSDHGTNSIPIIILAVAREAADRIAGLEAGADDYIGKPCNQREVVLRVRAVLRRGKRTVTEEEFVRGPIRVDPARCHVAIDNRKIHLTAVEFKLLRTLVKQPGQVQSREALQGAALGNGERLESRTIDTHIRRLRRKLGKAAYLVETIRGSGYRLRPT